MSNASHVAPENGPAANPQGWRARARASSGTQGRLCCAAVDTPEARTPSPEPAHHDVAADGDLQEGEMVSAVVDGRELAVCRVDGQIYAVSLRCTHAAWLMKDGPLEGVELVCGLHGARFDVRDGHPTCGPAERPLDTWPVRVRAGRVEVALPPRRRGRRPLAAGSGAA